MIKHFRNKLFKGSFDKIDIWNSPTLMTWMSYLAKSISLIGVLPLVLNRFKEGDIVLWYLFSTVIALQTLADFGFRQAFSRIISYAYSGATDIGVSEIKNEVISNREINISLLRLIISAQKIIYKYLTFFVVILMLSIGSWSIAKPIHEGASIVKEAWFSWIAIVVASSISFYSRIYMNYLEGLNKIAVVRRVETFTSLGSVFTSITLMIYSPSLMNLVLVNQFWIIIASLRDLYLARSINADLYSQINVKVHVDKVFLKKIWSPAWRGGIGGLMSAGLTNLSSIVYAQIGSTSDVSAFLLAMRLIMQIRDVSMAPFYSKLPLMNILRAQNKIDELTFVVKKGMKLSHLVFVIGFIFIAIFINPILELIHSNSKFVDMRLWGLIGFAFFAHRFGAMHIQVYLTTNHVISHIADGLAGAIFIISAWSLSDIIGIYAIPSGMILGYLFFYCWFTASYSYKSLNIKYFWKFEKGVSFPSLILMLFSLIIIIIIRTYGAYFFNS